MDYKKCLHRYLISYMIKNFLEATLFHNNLCLQNYFNNKSQNLLKSHKYYTVLIYISNTTFSKSDKGLEYKFSSQTKILCTKN